jgi:hypothetical protein
VGVDIHHRHGAVRTTGKPSIPEVAWPETHETLVGNDVNNPKVPRNSVSCRKIHPESTYGHYVPPIDNQGIPRKREGFMMPCLFDSHCHSRCGEHPIHGAPLFALASSALRMLVFGSWSFQLVGQ